MNCIQARVTSHVHRAFLIIFVMSAGTILHADESERRLLLPLNVVTQGAYGSVFSTHLTAINNGDVPVEIRGIDRFCAIPTCDRPPIPVTVRALRQADNLVLDQWSLPLSNPANEYEPACAQLPLPAWGISLVRIEITPQSEQFPVWAFASVTNNITQQFTLVTPRQVH